MKSFFDNNDDKHIEYKILEERNLEIKNLEKDIEDISEIMSDLSLLIFDQGESLEICVKNVENTEISVNESVKSLENVEIYVNNRRKILRNFGIIIGGATVGAIGFVVGPIVGAATIVSGGVLGSGIAFLTNKLI